MEPIIFHKLHAECSTCNSVSDHDSFTHGPWKYVFLIIKLYGGVSNELFRLKIFRVKFLISFATHITYMPSYDRIGLSTIGKNVN